jgi:hypothetical protein
VRGSMIVVLLTAIVTGLVCIGSGWGQSGIPADPAVLNINSDTTEPESRQTKVRPLVLTGNGSFVTGQDASATSIRSEIKQLVDKLHQTNDPAAKADLLKRLETAVSKLFDEDLKMHEAHLSQLEERVTKLRGQLERRRKSKAEITELQTKALAIDAEGLGFSGPPLLEDSVLKIYTGPTVALPGLPPTEPLPASPR